MPAIQTSDWIAGVYGSFHFAMWILLHFSCFPHFQNPLERHIQPSTHTLFVVAVVVVVVLAVVLDLRKEL